jgi:succinate dehydrogenase hydrophobic anchor subunit
MAFLIPATLATDNPILNYIITIAITTHAYLGLTHVVTDYTKIIFGSQSVIPMILKSIITLVAATALIGWLRFNYQDRPTSVAIKKLWTL